MMSMQTMLDPQRAKDLTGRFGFRFGEAAYVADIADGSIDVRRGQTEGADVLFSAAPEEIAGVLYGGAPLDSIAIEGDIVLARRFVTLFPLPPKVEPAR
jgi:hypothetical protein